MNSEPTFYVITVCWNESNILKYFLDYYSFATKIIVFDNMSSDNSVDIMKKYNNVEICYYNTNEQIRDDVYLEIKNNCWRQYRNECDWFIIVDIDEFIYHPLGIPNYVKSLPKNVAIAQCLGFEMFCPNILEVPGSTLLDKSKIGMPGNKLNKYSLINSKLTVDINYLPGCHQAFPKVNGIVYNDSKFKLLHYKFIFPLQYMIFRYQAMAKRLSQENIQGGYGFHYTNMNSLAKKYNELTICSKQII